MSKTLLIVLSVIGFLFFFGLVGAGVNNKAVNYEENVNQADSDIKISEKRKHDLILNIVNVIEKEMEFEHDTLVDIVKLRSGVESGSVTTQQVNTAIKVAVEAYPQLQTNKDFQNLTMELSVTENDLKSVRKYRNETVRNYRSFVKRFPNGLFLGLAGYDIQSYEYLNYDETDLPSKLFE